MSGTDVQHGPRKGGLPDARRVAAGTGLVVFVLAVVLAMAFGARADVAVLDACPAVAVAAEFTRALWSWLARAAADPIAASAPATGTA